MDTIILTVFCAAVAGVGGIVAKSIREIAASKTTNEILLEIARVYLKTQNCTKRQEKDIKGFYHRQYKEVIA